MNNHVAENAGATATSALQSAQNETRTAFIQAMRRAASTVCVVTTAGPGGSFGVTVSAMTSVTADPPTVLVCVNKTNLVIPAVVANQGFCVNFLKEVQKDVAEVFAGRRLAPEDGDRFSCAEWKTLRTGSPVLNNATAMFDCTLKEYFECGSHILLIGIVVDVDAGDGPTLVYHDRDYCKIVPFDT